MNKIKIVPIYFPQFHAIQENSEWWGEGFTDWANVKSGQPVFEGHHQPRVPLNNNYYDLSKPEAIRWQIDLAKTYGIYGFNIYHYWFDGRQMLKVPKEHILHHKEWDIKFALNWANERWTTRWEGTKDKVLIEQTHEPSIEKWEEHFLYLLDFFRDDRYIRIDGKPIFTIYRPHLVKKRDDMIAYWQKRARESGIDGLYMIAVKSSEWASMDILDSFDACMHFQPFETVNSPAMLGKSAGLYRLLRRLPEGMLNVIRSLAKNARKTYRIYDFETVCRNMIDSDIEKEKRPVFPSMFLEWDNAARYKERATIYQGCTPERFEYWLDRLCQKTMASANTEKIIFINAWNEWAEGTYLEPDTRSGYRYLEAVKRCSEKYGGT
ncbi:MAG: glycoside hydrolase family 99-like domain-containing protein [Eubacteriales bacterium]|nr:glycoside hydrolase family 99-like domain-containing protein [Eubacteriales bacterium]